MSAPNVEFPECVALGATRTPTWSTEVLETPGAWGLASPNWVDVQHTYDVSLAVRTASDYALVLAHFHANRGRLYAFPFKDHLDYQVTKAEGSTVLITGTAHQLQKQYGSVNPYVRKITRPKQGTLTFYRTRGGIESLAFGSVDYTTGVYVPLDHVGGDTYRWTGEFRVPVRYGDDKLPAVIIDREPNAGELLVECASITLQEDKE